jgi:hypothetical protein
MNPRQHAVALLEFTRKISNDILNGITDDKLTHQPSPTDNHALWVMGHLAATDAWIADTLNIPGVKVPESVTKAYSGGAKPTQKGNPPASEVRKAFNESRVAVMGWLREASDSALAVDLKEKTGGFATDPIDAMLKISWHEGWHMGQVANVRKALGLPNVLG